MFACTGLSAIAGLCLCKSMQLIPYNERFQQRYEFTNIAMIFFSYRQYQVFFLFFIVSLFTSVVPLIIQSAQVMDFSLIAIFGKTCGLTFAPTFGGVCTSTTGAADPFVGAAGAAADASPIVLSLGLVVLAAACVPISFWNLDDNMKIQVGSTVGMLVLIGIWVIYFCTLGLAPSSLPVVGTDVSKILGVVVFNYGFITSLPSWVNEKSPSTSVSTSVYWAVMAATLLTLLLGIFGALAYAPFFASGGDILAQLQQSGSVFIRITYYLFPIMVNLSSIPVSCIIIRYNLLSNQIVSRRTANVLAIGLPWLCCVPFYGGKGFSQFIVWSGVVINGTVNFLVPVYIYILAVRKYANAAAAQQSDLGFSFLGPHSAAAASGADASRSELEYQIYGDLNGDGGSGGGGGDLVPHNTLLRVQRGQQDDAFDTTSGDDEFVDPLHALSDSAPASGVGLIGAAPASLLTRCVCFCVPAHARPSRTTLAWAVVAIFFGCVWVVFGLCNGSESHPALFSLFG